MENRHDAGRRSDPPTTAYSGTRPLLAPLAAAAGSFAHIRPVARRGRVAAVRGLLAEVVGLADSVAVGERINLLVRPGQPLAAEIVGFRDGRALALPFGPLDGIGPGCVAALEASAGLAIGQSWIGRVVDGLGRVIDGKGPLASGPAARSRPTRASAPPAGRRERLGPRLDLGIAALDIVAPCRLGQRLGLFAGSGVGKSTLLAMLARHAGADVIVFGLVGERGRELREFIEDDLGPEGLKRSVIVCATSDAAPALRRAAAETALAAAEYFRDQGQRVLLLLDSVTRYAMALREIGLAAGEPPATRGYPPSVFAELPRLLERAGPGLARDDGKPAGSITAFFTVLVEGDDMNEPIADAVRGILDGHVVLDRAIAEAGRFPAVDLLRSLSRSAPGCLDPADAAAVARARGLLAVHADMAEMVRLGAYRAGTDRAVDEAMRLAPRIEALVVQSRERRARSVETFSALRAILAEADAPPPPPSAPAPARV
ncbi:MAG: flagellar protein export ATPase FliI [Alphaproteobacteria bacterium]|nr:flagellar protein export ATPase FliI [Alphaproteobacteria bacterium]